MGSTTAECKQQEREELWKKQWDKKEQAEQIRERNRQQALARTAEAQTRTAEAQAVLESLRKTLLRTLDVNDAVDWERLKDKRPFTKPAPKRPAPRRRTGPEIEKVPAPPDQESYKPKLGLFARIFPWVKAGRLADADLAFESAYQSWLWKKTAIEQRNAEALRKHEEALKAFEEEKKRSDAEYARVISTYEQERREYIANQECVNAAIEKKKADYMAGEAGAIIDYCEMVLNNSQYPEFFPKDFDIDYEGATRVLVVDYVLPSVEDIPTLTEVRYIATKNVFKEAHLSEREVNGLYDDLIYQVTLRGIHELFEADVAGSIDAVVFNGVVTSVNKATGHPVTSCILSIQAKKDEFLKIDLGRVDPRACFKALKGVGSSKLHSMTAVPPIITINREDKRFIDARAVADSLKDSANLAAMDWEDFEHFIREVFEMEFSKTGGEIRITRASRDRGVDAVAFDPDPIRGGKIVIQAKRYTNTVDVSAVRDLYGTVLNEGATKGILVTTSDYGPDAYEFAKDKPITLLNGGHLLHMLEKHGRRARIDLDEAKKLLKDQ